MLYRMYIDEVGNHDLVNADNPNHRFLGLTEVIIESDYLRNIIQPQMDSIKRKFFSGDPDEPVIFHRKEMMNKQGPFRVFWDKKNK